MSRSAYSAQPFGVARTCPRACAGSGSARRRGSAPARSAGDGRGRPRGSRSTPRPRAGTRVLPERRVPRATGPAEVLGRARVVHRRRAAGRRDHRLARAAPASGMSKCVPSSSATVRVEQLLVPALERVDALDRARRVVSRGARSPRRRSAPGRMRSATWRHRVLDAVQLVPAPRVGLVEVERRCR